MPEKPRRHHDAKAASGDSAEPVEAPSHGAQTWRDRFEEPVERATELTRRTLAWFPVRVWRHFLKHNGFLLAAGVSYQALFAIFAAIYISFATASFVVGGSEELTQGLIALINTYIPGLIGEDGPISVEAVESITSTSASLFGITGSVALIALIWTAIGWVTYSRYAVRDLFGLPKDTRSYVLLKARDLVAAIIFGAALLIGAGLGAFSTWALDGLFALFGWSTSTFWYHSAARVGAFIVAFAIDALALAGLFRFLSGAQLRWRYIWPGSLLGGAAIVVLQIGAGLLFSRGPSNPLLATFAVFVGLLLWFRLVGIVTLVAAAWIATSATDADMPLMQLTDAQRLIAEHAALTTAAKVRLRHAREERVEAPWFRVWSADRSVRAAEEELARLEASKPPPEKHGLLD